MKKLDRYDLKHTNNLVAIDKEVESIYNSAIKEAVKLSGSVNFSPDKPFSFADHPQIQNKVKRLVDKLRNNLTVVIANGINNEWNLANKKNDVLCHSVLGSAFHTLPEDKRYKYLATNTLARRAFYHRRVGGLSLSDRVWHYADSFKNEIEMGLDLGLRDGLSASSMARELKQYLQFPDKLFRRVRDEHGILHLSKNARAFTPGQGVYRSSYKNARRLAVTECNIAYRTADHLRWQDMDFVVGIEIKLSNNHTCLGADGKPHRFHDICDDLAGKYPKDFKFTGWHPHCRCYAKSILKTKEEIIEDNKRIMRGERVSDKSVNSITQPPKQFTEWVKDNKERLERAKSLPYFIKDNKKLILSGKYGYTCDKLGRKAENEAVVSLENHTALHEYSEEQKANFKEIDKALGIERGNPMTFDEADNGKANVVNDKNNCAACVFAHEMRLRGYNVTASPYDETEGSMSTLLSGDTSNAWLTAKNKKPEITKLKGSAQEILSKVEKQTQKIGSRYHIAYNIDEDYGHIITAERTDKGLILYDPQRNIFTSIENIFAETLIQLNIELLRVDKLLINKELLKVLSAVY